MTREALYDIFAPEFDEISVVDKGDNPPARIVLFKSAPPEMPSDEQIERWIDEFEEIEARKEKRMSTTITKAAHAAAAVRERAAEISKERPNLTPAEAFAKAMDEDQERLARYRELREADAQEPEESPYEAAIRRENARLAKRRENPALAEFLGIVEEIKKQSPNLTESAAWSEAHRLRPSLYARARRSERDR